MIVLLIGLVISLAVAVVVVLLVARAGLRAEGRLPVDEHETFRLPASWTGFEDGDEATDIFGEPVNDPVWPEPTTDPAAGPTAGRSAGTAPSSGAAGTTETTDAEDAPVAQAPTAGRLQPLRHAVPPLWTVRPRTRHWRVPPEGEGLRTALKLLFG